MATRESLDAACDGNVQLSGCRLRRPIHITATGLQLLLITISMVHRHYNYVGKLGELTTGHLEHNNILQFKSWQKSLTVKEDNENNTLRTAQKL
jgi:hypothetical protein